MNLPSARQVAQRTQRSLLSAGQWRARLVVWAGGAAVGGMAVAFAKCADLALAGLHRMTHAVYWLPYLLAPFGFATLSFLTRRYFAGAEGSGIPQTIFALTPEAGAVGERLLRVRVAVGRMLLAVAGLLCGGSIGREGPTVHVGAIITRALARFMPHGGTQAQQRAMVLAGGAAGVAAAFNTPLAGIVFAIEELSRSFEERASGTALTAVIISGVMAIALIGDYTYFGQPGVVTVPSVLAATTISVAIAGGLVGGLFSRIALIGVMHLPATLGRIRRNRPEVFAFLCGLAVAGIAAASGGLTYGTGYDEARSILVSGAHLPWYYAPARAAATLAAFFSGVPAGILSPSLSVGAGLGQTMADFAHEPSAVPFAILGMCGCLAGVTQAPLTSLVIVMEMTTQHAMVLPLMITAAIGTAVSKLLTPPLYQTLAQRYAPAPGANSTGRLHE
ncbi:MAG: chloride channel protein [Steroidobacteraceae bacterium]